MYLLLIFAIAIATTTGDPIVTCRLDGDQVCCSVEEKCYSGDFKLFKPKPQPLYYKLKKNTYKKSRYVHRRLDEEALQNEDGFESFEEEEPVYLPEQQRNFDAGGYQSAFESLGPKGLCQKTYEDHCALTESCYWCDNTKFFDENSFDEICVAPKIDSKAEDKEISQSFTGVFYADTAGYYGFKISSDDAGKMELGGSTIVYTPFRHQVVECAEEVYLKKGYYDIKLYWGNNGGSAGSFKFLWQAPNGEFKTTLSEGNFFAGKDCKIAADCNAD